MNSKNKKQKTPVSSTIMYCLAVIIGIIAIVYLVLNVKMYISSVAQYVAQGYAKPDVTRQLIPAQLLPGIFQPVALYGGISFILLSAGIINSKISRVMLSISDKNDSTPTVEDNNDIVEAAIQSEDSEENSNTQID